MKTLLKVSASILLVFNGAGAVYGGWSLIQYPDGSDLKMPLSLLDHSPFQSFLIPGVVLLLVNGIGSFVTFIFQLKNGIYSNILLAIQGIMLCGWILIQIGMIRQLLPLHYIMFSVGLLMIIIARLSDRKNRT